MADKVGDEFEGYVTGVSAFGLYIELIEHFVEGMVHVSTMADDYYRFVEKSHLLKGENTGSVSPRRPGARAGDQGGHGAAAGGPRALRDPRPRARVGAAPRAPAKPRAARSAKSTSAPRVRTRARENIGSSARANASARRNAVADSMRSIVVGTAGHIDHGKSSLVLALTGTDPDRLKEEKARGITIDLGFAHVEHGGFNFAFVDVPGHERFVRNMLAGAGGIDAVLLVVAADESVMPQTREHFDICRLLQVKAGLVALTKADLVDDDTLRVVQDSRCATS